MPLNRRNSVKPIPFFMVTVLRQYSVTEYAGQILNPICLMINIIAQYPVAVRIIELVNPE